MSRRCLVCVPLLALAAVPASAANKDMERLYLQIAGLQTQVGDLQRATEEVAREVRRLNELLAEQNAFVRKGVQERRTQDEAVQTALREMTDRLAELDARLSSVDGRLQTLRTAPAPVTTDAAPAGAPGAEPVGPAAVEPTPPPAPAPAEAPPPRELYSQAYADYARGNYDLAIQEYREYLRHYPQTDLSDNAQYWIGECLYAKKLFPEAIEAWTELQRRYPASDKLPDARFKTAMALERLGRRREALTHYRYVVERYPNSDAGRRARERLNPE